MKPRGVPFCLCPLLSVLPRGLSYPSPVFPSLWNGIVVSLRDFPGALGIAAGAGSVLTQGNKIPTCNRAAKPLDCKEGSHKTQRRTITPQLRLCTQPESFAVGPLSRVRFFVIPPAAACLNIDNVTDGEASLGNQ